MPSTESAIATITAPQFYGVWIHTPTNAAATLRNFFFAPSGKQESREAAAEMLVFAGRTLPVAEFGETESQRVDVEFLIPFSETWVDEVQAVKDRFALHDTLAYRDGRGRMWYGVLRAVKFEDVREGTTVNFTVDRVDYTALPIELIGGLSNDQGA